MTEDGNGTLLLRFLDVPAAIIDGCGESEAKLRAREALTAALER